MKFCCNTSPRQPENSTNDHVINHILTVTLNFTLDANFYILVESNFTLDANFYILVESNSVSVRVFNMYNLLY